MVQFFSRRARGQVDAPGECSSGGRSRPPQTDATPLYIGRHAGLAVGDSHSLQRGRAEPAWRSQMAQADIRGLTPLVWGHVSPYGAFLDMDRRLDLELRKAA